MMKSLALSAVALATVAAPAFAQSFVGGEVSLGYSTFTGDVDGDALNLSASAELAITRDFGIQADLGYTDFGDIGAADGTGADANSVALHVIYNLSDSASAGLFFGYESGTFDDGTTETEDDTTFVGVELGYEVGAVNFEFYYAKPLDEIIDNASFYGISGAYDINGAFAVTAGADRLTTDDFVDLTTVAIGAEYAVLPYITLGAEIGSASIDTGASSDSETFVGLGATFTFGAERGATFDSRGLAQMVPGY